MDDFSKVDQNMGSIPSTTLIWKPNIYTGRSEYHMMNIKWQLNIKRLPRCLRMARESHVRSAERDSLQKVENLDEILYHGWLWLCWYSSSWWFMENLYENPNQGSLWLWLCWWFPCSSIWWFMENLDENPYQGSPWSQTLHCWWFPFFFYFGNIDNHWRMFLMIYELLSLER